MEKSPPALALVEGEPNRRVGLKWVVVRELPAESVDDVDAVEPEET